MKLKLTLIEQASTTRSNARRARAMAELQHRGYTLVSMERAGKSVKVTGQRRARQ